jgi:hypothetical protein
MNRLLDKIKLMEQIEAALEEWGSKKRRMGCVSATDWFVKRVPGFRPIRLTRYTEDGEIFQHVVATDGRIRIDLVPECDVPDEGPIPPAVEEGCLFESSIDFPKPSLDLAIWQQEGDSYRMRQDVKDKIVRILDAYEPVDLMSMAREIRIVGSIGTNLYTDDVDIDVHIVPDDFSLWTEESVKELQVWFNENIDRLGGYIGKHPIEVYVQLVPSQDLLSDSAYDFLNDEWLVGPKVVSQDYDPYEDFSHIADDIRKSVQGADLLMGELKRDVIDFDTIKAAMETLPDDVKQRVHLKLKNKLQEIEDNIEALYGMRKDWVDARREISGSYSPEQVMQDVELAKKWKDINAQFKFINRYKYMKVVGDLEKLLSDDKISPEEVDVIKNVMGR